MLVPRPMAIGCPGEFLPVSMEILKHELRVPQLDFHHIGEKIKQVARKNWHERQYSDRHPKYGVIRSHYVYLYIYFVEAALRPFHF